MDEELRAEVAAMIADAVSGVRTDLDGLAARMNDPTEPPPPTDKPTFTDYIQQLPNMRKREE